MEKVDIKLYNTLTRKKELFKPLKKGVVRMYTCGPTVYGYVHIGNFRSFIFEDILRRVLQTRSYKVKHIMNVTDVDDKTIIASQKAGKELGEFTKFYEKTFEEDLKKLHILLPTKPFTRATEHIPEMITLIQKLLRRKYAYEKDGSVYFDVSRFARYGKLAHLDKKGLKAGARVDVDEYAKNAAQDFALWKAKKDGEPSWSAPFGEGRPGWHIECSAMSLTYLGQPFDIHAGGVDLIFPHHENEIAQSEAAIGKPFVRYWLHGEHLLVDGHKMSKSLGNTFTLRTLEEKGFSPLDFRYLTLGAHYRSKLNFTWQSLESAKNAHRELEDFTRELLKEKKRMPKDKKKPYALFEKNFMTAIADDLGAPRALGILWKFIHTYRKAKTRQFGAQVKHPAAAYALLLAFDKILGLGLRDIKHVHIPVILQQLVEKRESARRAKHWLEADSLREEIRRAGWDLNDTPEGPVVAKQ